MKNRENGSKPCPSTKTMTQAKVGDFVTNKKFGGLFKITSMHKTLITTKLAFGSPLDDLDMGLIFMKSEFRLATDKDNS